LNAIKGFASRLVTISGCEKRSLFRYFTIILHMSVVLSLILADVSRTPFVTLAKAGSSQMGTLVNSQFNDGNLRQNLSAVEARNHLASRSALIREELSHSISSHVIKQIENLESKPLNAVNDRILPSYNLPGAEPTFYLGAPIHLHVEADPISSPCVGWHNAYDVGSFIAENIVVGTYVELEPNDNYYRMMMNGATDLNVWPETTSRLSDPPAYLRIPPYFTGAGNLIWSDAVRDAIDPQLQVMPMVTTVPPGGFAAGSVVGYSFMGSVSACLPIYGDLTFRPVYYGIPPVISQNSSLSNNSLKSGDGDPRECSISNVCQDSQAYAGDPINTHSGNFDYSLVDLSVPSVAGPLSFQRSYASAATSLYTTTLGAGWTHNQDIRLIFPGDVGGEAGVVWFKGQTANQYQFIINDDGTFRPYAGVLASLLQEPDGSYRLTASDQSVYTFFSDGKLDTWKDARGHGFTYLYDDAQHSHLIRVEDENGLRFLEFQYDPANPERISTVTDSGGRSVSYAYNTNGDLETFSDVTGQVYTYTYDSGHHLRLVTTQVADPDPRTLTLVHTEYDASGRAYQQYDGQDRLVLQITYNPDGTTNLQDGLGNQRTHTYDGRNTNTQQVDPASGVLSKAYNSDFHPKQVTDPAGNSTYFSWSLNGANLTYVRDAAGNQAFLDYDSMKHRQPGLERQLHLQRQPADQQRRCPGEHHLVHLYQRLQYTAASRTA
jgi:YD repeat-containing protein